jgi:hypothetical protein
MGEIISLGIIMASIIIVGIIMATILIIVKYITIIVNV